MEMDKLDRKVLPQCKIKNEECKINKKTPKGVLKMNIYIFLKELS